MMIGILTTKSTSFFFHAERAYPASSQQFMCANHTTGYFDTKVGTLLTVCWNSRQNSIQLKS